MLEDDFNDVLGKSIRGLELSAAQLGVSPTELNSILSGHMDVKLVAQLAQELNLSADKLIELENYTPSVSTPDCLHTFVSSFGHLGVNSFVLETENHLIIFDTGTNSRELETFINQHSTKTSVLYITHSHPDHTSGVTKLSRQGIKVYLPQEAKNTQYDQFSITCLDVAGHCTPATAYFIESPLLDQPLCIVGDAIFAGSTGGCHSLSNYHTALSNIRENILTLPASTILCPGHGPLTTVAQECEHNPFFA